MSIIFRFNLAEQKICLKAYAHPILIALMQGKLGCCRPRRQKVP